MTLKWTDQALGDVERVYRFLCEKAPAPAARVVQTLTAAAQRLLENPRIGPPLMGFEPREVRKLMVNSYEMRYEIRERTIIVRLVWSAREDR